MIDHGLTRVIDILFGILRNRNRRMINDGGRFRKLFLRLLLLHLLSCILKGGFLRHILFGATALFCLYEGYLSRAIRLVAVVSVRSLHLDDFILAKGQTANLCLALIICL